MPRFAHKGEIYHTDGTGGKDPYFPDEKEIARAEGFLNPKQKRATENRQRFYFHDWNASNFERDDKGRFVAKADRIRQAVEELKAELIDTISYLDDFSKTGLFKRRFLQQAEFAATVALLSENSELTEMSQAVLEKIKSFPTQEDNFAQMEITKRTIEGRSWSFVKCPADDYNFQEDVAAKARALGGLVEASYSILSRGPFPSDPRKPLLLDGKPESNEMTILFFDGKVIVNNGEVGKQTGNLDSANMEEAVKSLLDWGITVASIEEEIEHLPSEDDWLEERHLIYVQFGVFNPRPHADFEYINSRESPIDLPQFRTRRDLRNRLFTEGQKSNASIKVRVRGVDSILGGKPINYMNDPFSIGKR